MHLLSHFHELSLHPKNAKELRGLILQLAIQGKLTAQWRKENPDVEPTSELFARIKEEKARLIAEKKIRKEKLLPEVVDDEVPFQVPAGWFWCRLRALISLLGDGIHGTPNYSLNGEYFFINGNNLTNGVIEIKPRTKRVSYEEFLKHKRVLNDKTVLVSINGTIGNVAFYNDEKVMLGKSACYFNLLNGISKEYVKEVINSDYFMNYATSAATGTTIKNVSLRTMRLFPIPLPPLAEQKAIVATVDQLFKEIEQLETLTETRVRIKEDFATSALRQLTTGDTAKEWAFLREHFHPFFNEAPSIKKLRETILQLAVQGKLTTQWRVAHPDVEPASELLARIKAEKAQLIAEKKIRKEKPLPEIEAEEVPYEVPEGWVWCHMGEISEFINGDRGKNYPNKSEYVEQGIPWINTGHIDPDGSLSIIRMNYITREKFDSLRSGKIQSGDLVYCLRGATFGKTALVDPVTEGAIASSLMIIRPFGHLLRKYIYSFLISPEGKIQLFRFDNGSAQPNLSANKVKLYAFPLPPLTEQEAIVEQVNRLMSLCDALEQQILVGQVQVEMLMRSVLREVFEGARVEA